MIFPAPLLLVLIDYHNTSRSLYRQMAIGRSGGLVASRKRGGRVPESPLVALLLP